MPLSSPNDDVPHLSQKNSRTQEAAMFLVETFANQWFSISFSWRDGLLVQTELSPDILPATPPKSAYGRELERLVAGYDRLARDMWPELPLDTRSLTPFALNVLRRLRQGTPRGSWTTYGRLAAACGSPGAARAVGSVMARNPWALIYPCHRVLAGDGSIGGFGPGTALKRTLLTLEKAWPEQKPE